MYVATGGPNVKWGGTDLKWGGRAPLAPPLATTMQVGTKNGHRTFLKKWKQCCWCFFETMFVYKNKKCKFFPQLYPEPYS